MAISYPSSSRICLFVYSFTGGGAEKMMVNVANELHAREYQVELVLVDATGPYKSLVDPEIDVSEIGGSNTIEIQYNLWKYLRNNETDVLLSTMEIPNIVSVVATRPLSIPVVLRIANINSMKERHGKYQLIPILKRLTYSYAESIVTISDGVAHDLAGITDIDETRMRTIYNSAFDPEIPENSREPVDHEWLNDDDKNVVIGVGSLKPQKDFSTLLDAIHQIENDNSHLIILGKGDLKQDLVQQANELGIRDRISFPGFVDNPYAYMAKADVFALSSAWEGFGNVIVEAMACETPVVCTDCPGGPAEILDDGTYGPLVPVGDDAAMAEAIQEMLDDPTDTEPLVSRAQDFTIEKIVDQYEEELLSVAKD
ncbi:glycosyltransferase [Natronorubrum thiooxidans]|uniref:Glycosyltransferase involved in cell wall bisynthesis n=1 Tax=Natronorubrum thiooxidans TaxID=308853 RepID=A0A1N7GCX2_9EURY|nr:glycosyltransferase [Natronorubrum thiooxidans]SIS10421.1 Glycosyltransferase involved in cell wall bisynthesis [Natronorubrum thiooxidans]